MRLLNMDVDRNGTDEHIEIGPLGAGLNAICGPRGSGKTTLLSWLRQIAADAYGRDYYDPAWHQTRVPISGAVNISDRGRTFRAITDRAGHVRFEAATNGRASNGYSSGYNADEQYRNDSTANSLTQSQREIFSGLAAASGTADTEHSLTQLAQRIGIESASVPVAGTTERARLLARQAELQQQLSHTSGSEASRDSLLTRKSELESQLNQLRSQPASPVLNSDQGRLDSRLRSVETELNTLRSDIEQIDRDTAQLQAELKLLETDNCAVDIGASYREKLSELDDRLNRWRQTLRDLKLHRERIEHDTTDARLEHQIGDQLSVLKNSDPRAALRSLEATILNTRKQLDELVGKFGNTDAVRRQSGYDVVRDENGETRIAYTDAYRNVSESTVLPEMLQSMQKDLYEVCQQLARHESHTATATLREQSQQLRRCEKELLQSVEKLIEERAVLLRRIADEHHLSVEQLTLAFGQWCQCHDHPHLHQWLLEEESSRSSLGDSAGNPERRQMVLEQIERLRKTRKDAELRSAECRRQLRETSGYRSELAAERIDNNTNVETTIFRDLDRINSQLHQWESTDHMRSELAEVSRQLSIDVGSTNPTSKFRRGVDSHIANMMGSFTRDQADRTYRSAEPRRYDPVDGQVSDAAVELETYEKRVPNGIVRIAMRLTIADEMRNRGEPISILLDEVVDGLPIELQQRAIKYLGSVSAGGQQIVVLTCDERVSQLVHSHRGWVGYMHAQAQEKPKDVNRLLTAFANEHEADKWYQPAPGTTPYRGTRSDYYLDDSSLIEEHPSVDATSAARCRAMDIDRIGDLLDVDPSWLADQVQISGVSAAVVSRWQSESRLLCSVRHLRPFDARIIVGAGVRSAQQLAEMPPTQLLQRVEDFLTTERGRRILDSGSDYELSRIKNWVASANNGTTRYDRNSFIRDRDYDREQGGRHRSESRRSRRDYDYDRGRSPRSSRSRSSRSERSPRTERTSRDSQRTRRSDRSRHRIESDSRRTYPMISRSEQDERTRSERPRRRTEERVQIVESKPQDDSSEARLKFYLELSSPVVDAPTIGTRMAQRLEKQGIFTVDQLLAADPEQVADRMNNRRVDADAVRAWQLQAQLVCRIPNLRGHDAQMLVACQITSPEELAGSQASQVLSDTLAFAQSSEGQRILRGSKEPDMDEVTDWISWANSSRSLNAA